MAASCECAAFPSTGKPQPHTMDGHGFPLVGKTSDKADKR